MSEKKVAEETISKALEQLQDLAKGHSSRGTAATEVDSMRDGSVGAGSSAGATQVHHTSSNSDPKGWAGSTARDVPENGATDAINENGTDYDGGAQMMKSVIRKIAKGLPLTTAEKALYAEISKGRDEDEDDMDKAQDPPAKRGSEDPHAAALARKNGDDDDDEDTKKSLTDYAQSNEDVNKGLELSSFLAGWADVQNRALSSTESRILTNVRKSLGDLAARQEDFNGDLAKSVASLAEVLSLQAQRIEQLESTPARGPKSQTAVPVEKSFGAGGPAAAQGGESLNKSQILETMVDMVEKGSLDASEVLRFESTSQLNPQVEEKIRAHRAGR